MVAIRKRKQVSYTESDSDFMSEEEISVRSKVKVTKDTKVPKSKAKISTTKPKKVKKEDKVESEVESESELESESEEDVKKKTAKNNKKQKVEESEDEEIVTSAHFKNSKVIVPRPKGSPFPDAIPPDSLQFIADLIENNDRDFMRLHAKEWDRTRKDFIDFCKLLMDEIRLVDPAVRLEEARDAVYRQNRDLRFSNDKRPYKGSLSAGFSRQGRKFTDAGYYLVVKPGNQSFIAGGMWQPNSSQLQNMRSMIIRNSALLKEALSTDALKEIFDGKYGHEIMDSTDKLKTSPKNIAKDHPEIDLLRYRSFVICKYFTDEEVVSEGFLDKVMDVVEATVPFVTVINSWV